MNRSAEAFNQLIEVMNELRQKCPWDAKQTIDSLRHLTIEENLRAGRRYNRKQS